MILARPSTSPRRWLLPLVFAVSSALAQNNAAPTAKPSGKEYALAHASSFNAMPAGSRNPFWPIGWVPSAPVAAPVAMTQQAVDVKAENFVVTSISVDAPALAVINGRTYGVGDRIPVSAADPRETVTVKQIRDGEVVFDYRGRELRSTSRRSSGR